MKETKRRLFDLDKNLLLKSTESASFCVKIETGRNRGHRFLCDSSPCLIICKIGERNHKDLFQSRSRFHRKLIVDFSHTTDVQSNTNESDKHYQLITVHFHFVIVSFS